MAQTMLLASSGPFPPPSYVVIVIVVSDSPSHIVSDLATLAWCNWCWVVVVMLPFIGDATTCSSGGVLDVRRAVVRGHAVITVLKFVRYDF
jgi:hypothetical protein